MTFADAENLSPDVCWALMRTTTVGRLAVVVDDHPDIFPLNFVIDHGTVVFRTAEGTKVGGAMGSPVAFEADGYDVDTNRAWSVVVRGRAHSITEVDEVMDTTELPLHPWHGGAKDRFMRITPDGVTGRRFEVADPSAWPTTGSHSTVSD